MKGQGLDENMKPTKIDKKKVAYGKVRVNDEGIFEFCVMGGVMKIMEAKQVMKSNTLLKNKIGDKYVIIKGEGSAPEETGDEMGDKTTDQETETPTTRGDGMSPEENTSTTEEQAPVDGKEIAAEFSKIDAAYKKIAGASSNQERLKLALIVYKNIQTFRPKLEAYVEQASGKNQEQAKKMLQVIDSYYTKLEPIASQIDEKQSQKSVKNMEDIYTNIGSAIDDLLQNAGVDIDTIPGLKEVKESIRK